MNKAEDPGKMKQESDLLLQSAVNKRDEILKGDKPQIKGAVQGNLKLSPRQKQSINDDLSDYGSADIDEITKVK